MKDRVFRDPVHGLIELRGPDRAIADLLDTFAVQRLRRIKQMGFAWLVYPVTEHAELRDALEALEPGLPATLRAFWGKGYRPRFARKLVSSQLDVDRLDY